MFSCLAVVEQQSWQFYGKVGNFFGDVGSNTVQKTWYYTHLDRSKWAQINSSSVGDVPLCSSGSR